ncbi:fluoroquinolone transport system ATP-binding protein [Catalinimonas alkaloidigena]|uniref:Fluoroquinolone transport system ATP-binding protein n=1 Tax=Catalinimonas alkaloidigena TaxID=1075417 RepID=A0A1G9SA65_9BACT|nr:ABC transporter ATP-binding protein [Catalinimonas alkaloidigena]SDM32292.1 fluoroquinolone transport system ATP-binding protein [Catalinimonas alkaloidigena]
MIQVDQLRFRYPGAPADTLHGLSFDIAPGEIFGFLGPSGSGKSTTQKILYKLLDGYQGEVRIDGKSLRQWGKEFYEFIGVGFELPNHYAKLTARENLRFFGAFYSKKAYDPMELLARVGLADDADKRVSDFSKGMKMRLNFVRALLHDPQVLFLDEPTSGLDPVNARLIKDWILDLKGQSKTIFVTTHSMYDADTLCDRVALIISGELMAMDRPEALKYQYGQRKVRVQVDGESAPREFALADLGQNDQFLAILQRNGIRTIHSEEATLEDVFIKITGTALT